MEPSASKSLKSPRNLTFFFMHNRKERDRAEPLDELELKYKE